MRTIQKSVAMICVACVLCPALAAQDGAAVERLPVYRSNRGRNIKSAHRVALALGPGHHVLTRVQSGKTYRGHIDTVDPDKLTLRLDRTGQAIAIPYAEIDHLEQNLSRLAKIGIVAATAAGVGFLLFWRYVIDLDD